MTMHTTFRLAAGAALLALVTAAADGAEARKNKNNRKNAKADDFYKAELDANGREIVPPVTDGDRYARYVIFMKDANHDHKLSRAEAAMSNEQFDAIDTSKDAFLDLKEVKAALQKFVADAKKGDAKKDDAKKGEDEKPAERKEAKKQDK